MSAQCYRLAETLPVLDSKRAADLVIDPLPKPPEARKIAVVRLGSLGDVVRTRFAVAGLRALYPTAQIDWWVEDRAAPGLVGITEIDQVVCLPRRELRLRRPTSLWCVPARVVAELRERRYDLSVDFHSILKSAALVAAARVPVRIGYDWPLAREGAQRLLTHRVRLRRTHLSRFERNAALLAYLGGHAPERPPRLDLSPEACAEVEGLGSGFAVIHPGTSRDTLYKRWEPEHYATVARALRDRLDVHSVVTWGPVPGERECAERVVEQACGAAELAPATRSIEVLLALLARARIFIGSDSGPMHLAALVGCPLAVVFGPTDPIENAPFPGVSWRMLREDVGCNPCREGCPARSCMAAVSPSSVIAAAEQLLEDTRAS